MNKSNLQTLSRTDCIQSERAQSFFIFLFKQSTVATSSRNLVQKLYLVFCDAFEADMLGNQDYHFIAQKIRKEALTAREIDVHNQERKDKDIHSIVDKLGAQQISSEHACSLRQHLGLEVEGSVSAPGATEGLNQILSDWILNSPACSLEDLISALVRTPKLGRLVSDLVPHCYCNTPVICKLIRSVGKYWKHLARFLGFTEEVYSIENSCSTDVDCQIQMFLRVWCLPDCGPRTSEIIEGLKTSAGVPSAAYDKTMTDHSANSDMARTPPDNVVNFYSKALVFLASFFEVTGASSGQPAEVSPQKVPATSAHDMTAALHQATLQLRKQQAGSTSVSGNCAANVGAADSGSSPWHLQQWHLQQLRALQYTAGTAGTGQAPVNFPFLLGPPEDLCRNFADQPQVAHMAQTEGPVTMPPQEQSQLAGMLQVKPQPSTVHNDGNQTGKENEEPQAPPFEPAPVHKFTDPEILQHSVDPSSQPTSTSECKRSSEEPQQLQVSFGCSSQEIGTPTLTDGMELISACVEGDWSLAQALIETGCPLEARSEDGKTPLIHACIKGNIDCIKRLVFKEADLEALDCNGRCVFHFPEILRNEDLMNYLVQACVTLDIAIFDLPAVDGNSTPLMVACSIGDSVLQAADLLLKNGANPNGHSNAQCRPLVEACGRGHKKLVELLLQYDADLNIQDKSGCTALLQACNCSQSSIALLLLDRNVNVNRSDRNGTTPLFSAVQANSYEIVQRLIHKGVHINATRYMTNPLVGGAVEETVLAHACARGFLEIVKLLTMSGADVNYLCSGTVPPIGFAIICKQNHVVKFLLRNKDLNKTLHGLSGPVIIAVKVENFDCAKWLLSELGGEEKALHKAQQNRMFQLVEHIETHIAMTKGMDIHPLEEDAVHPIQAQLQDPSHYEIHATMQQFCQLCVAAVMNSERHSKEDIATFANEMGLRDVGGFFRRCINNTQRPETLRQDFLGGSPSPFRFLIENEVLTGDDFQIEVFRSFGDDADQFCTDLVRTFYQLPGGESLPRDVHSVLQRLFSGHFGVGCQTGLLGPKGVYFTEVGSEHGFGFASSYTQPLSKSASAPLQSCKPPENPPKLTLYQSLRQFSSTSSSATMKRPVPQTDCLAQSPVATESKRDSPALSQIPKQPKPPPTVMLQSTSGDTICNASLHVTPLTQTCTAAVSKLPNQGKDQLSPQSTILRDCEPDSMQPSGQERNAVSVSDSMQLSVQGQNDKTVSDLVQPTIQTQNATALDSRTPSPVVKERQSSYVKHKFETVPFTATPFSDQKRHSTTSVSMESAYVGTDISGPAVVESDRINESKSEVSTQTLPNSYPRNSRIPVALRKHQNLGQLTTISPYCASDSSIHTPHQQSSVTSDSKYLAGSKSLKKSPKKVSPHVLMKGFSYPPNSKIPVANYHLGKHHHLGKPAAGILLQQSSDSKHRKGLKSSKASPKRVFNGGITRTSSYSPESKSPVHHQELHCNFGPGSTSPPHSISEFDSGLDSVTNSSSNVAYPQTEINQLRFNHLQMKLQYKMQQSQLLLQEQLQIQQHQIQQLMKERQN